MNAVNPYAPPQGAVHDIRDDDSIEPASRLVRLAAWFIDGVIYWVIVGIGVVVASAIAVNGGGRPQLVVVYVAIGMLGGAVLWGAITWVFVADNGQTMAKRMLGIKVVRSDGSRASVARIFWLRNGIGFVIWVLFFPYWLVDVLFIFGDERKCLHDMMADTIVVIA